MAALNASKYVLIPVKPTPFTLSGIKDLIDIVSKIKNCINNKLRILGIILNLVEGRKTIMGEELETVLRGKYGNMIFRTTLNKGVKLEESPSFCQSVMEYSPKSKQAIQFDQLLSEFIEHYGKQKKKIDIKS